MWPFGKSQDVNKQGVASFERLSDAFIKRIQASHNAGTTTKTEAFAMAFAPECAHALAKAILQGGHIKDFKPGPIPAKNLTNFAGGYLVLLGAQFYTLREVMKNSPDAATTIGVQFDDLVSHFNSKLELDPRIVLGRLASIDNILTENDGDPRVVYLAVIDDFLNTLGADEFFPTSSLGQQVLWTLYSDTTIAVVRNLKEVLGLPGR